MQLFFDIGNTRIKVATYSQAKQTLALLANSQNLNDIVPHIDGAVDKIWVANVRASQDKLDVAKILEDTFACSVYMATLPDSCMGVSSAYHQGLGIDRFLALMAAWHRYACACVVVDCGTAVSIDVLDHNGVHQGGMIMPGLYATHHAVYNNTGIAPPKHTGQWAVLPMNTQDAVYTGCQLTWQAGIKDACHFITQHVPYCKIIVSGGDGEQCIDELRQLDTEVCLVPNMVLEGLQLYAKSQHA